MVAEERSFTKAANKLIIAQPSLSIFISKLEHRLGRELFDRSVTPLRLTPAGEEYVQMAQRVLALEMQTERRLQNMGDEQEYGRIVVGATAHRGQSILPRAVKQFRNKHPKYEITLRELKHGQILKSVDSGELDLCLALGPVDESKYNSVTILKEEETLLVVPSGFPINKEVTIAEPEGNRSHPTVSLGEFQDLPFVVVSEGYYTRLLLHDLCWRDGFHPKIAVESGSPEMCRALVLAGIGVTILPASTIDFANNNPKVVVYSLNQDYERRNVIVIYRKNHNLSEAAVDFLDILRGMTFTGTN